MREHLFPRASTESTSPQNEAGMFLSACHWQDSAARRAPTATVRQATRVALPFRSWLRQRSQPTRRVCRKGCGQCLDAHQTGGGSFKRKRDVPWMHRLTLAMSPYWRVAVL